MLGAGHLLGMDFAAVAVGEQEFLDSAQDQKVERSACLGMLRLSDSFVVSRRDSEVIVRIQVKMQTPSPSRSLLNE